MKICTFNTYILLFLTLGLTGCKGFLDESDLSNFTQDNYFTKPEHAESVVNAIYEDLRPTTSGFNFGGSPFLMLEFPTGLAGTEVGQNVDNNFLRTLTNNSDNLYGEIWWVNSYRGIGNANLAIARIPNIPMNAVRKQELLAEAHFLRAFYYYQLLRLFGDIPLIKEPIDAGSANLYPQRNTVEEVYNSIVEDLKFAESAPLPFQSTSGRATVGAAKSLLASCYLTMAGYPLNKGLPYFSLAAEKAKEVISSGKYRLFDTYDELRDLKNKNLGEHIFMTQYEAGIINNSIQDLFLPNNRNISTYSTESGAIFALKEFIETYAKQDRRIQEQQYYYTRYTSQEDRSVVLNLNNSYIFKYFDTEAHLKTAISGMNWPLLRYAEVLLIFAEAQNEVSGPGNDIYQALNMIRKRANLPEIQTGSQADLRKLIWQERYHELAFENKTWFDMVRTRKVYNLTTKEFDNFVGHKFTYGPILKERDLLFPIPTREITNNKKLSQNPGY
ncbi:RagB/SusD family nutrient uptake outer membrane protein [Sphingobacterium sp. Mn56C]|uniref:RagB/SusD family nutrient uptake outer membrane protein n=1 Tax=Sphingobacterium sp. Mn56C TaxID=3395261 RepID=UPI003BDA0FA8